MGIVGCPAPLQLARIVRGLGVIASMMGIFNFAHGEFEQHEPRAVGTGQAIGGIRQSPFDQHHHRGEGGDVKSKLCCGVAVVACHRLLECPASTVANGASASRVGRSDSAA